MKIDYSIYLVTDRRAMTTATLSEAVEQAILGGCTMVQLREKNKSTLDFYYSAIKVKKITDNYQIPLIINDRIDIALAINAAGVHIGQSDLPAAVVRSIIGKKMLLGVSATSVKEALKAQKDGADYLGIGAMYNTETKSDAILVTEDELKRIRQNVELPIVVIGGINKENAPIFRNMGINGLAIVSAILSKPNIKWAAEEIKNNF